MTRPRTRTDAEVTDHELRRRRLVDNGLALRAAAARLQAQAKEQERAAKTAEKAALAKLEDAVWEGENDPTRAVEMATPIAGAAALLDEHRPGWRKRRKVKEVAQRRQSRQATATPQFETVDGHTIVRVPLLGKYGTGRSIRMDLPDWQRIEPACGGQWTVLRTGAAQRERVGSGRKDAVEGARRLGFPVRKAPIVTLARLVAEAAPHEEIVYDNGDPLDLRYSNLHVVDRHTLARFEHDLARDHWARPAEET